MVDEGQGSVNAWKLLLENQQATRHQVIKASRHEGGKVAVETPPGV